MRDEKSEKKLVENIRTPTWYNFSLLLSHLVEG